MVSRSEFLERRRTGIGGSDVSAILGLSPYRTAYDVWREKTGRAQEHPENSRTHFGNVLEQVVADEFAARNAVKVQRRNEMFRHTEHPELIANIDRYIVGGGILECKTADRFMSDQFGESGQMDSVPEYYLMQVQHYMYVTGYRKAFIAVLIGGNDFRQFEIQYDSELAEYSAARCVEFWQSNIVNDDPPPAMTSKEAARLYSATPGKAIEASGDVLAMIAELKAVKSEMKEYEKTEEKLKTSILEAVRDAEIILDGNGGVIATYKKQKDTVANVTDYMAIVEALGVPDSVIDSYTSQKVIRKGARPFKIK